MSWGDRFIGEDLRCWLEAERAFQGLFTFGVKSTSYLKA